MNMERDYYLGVNNEDLSLRDAHFKVAEFISVPISKSCVKWVLIWRKQGFNVLERSSKDYISLVSSKTFNDVNSEYKILALCERNEGLPLSMQS